MTVTRNVHTNESQVLMVSYRDEQTNELVDLCVLSPGPVWVTPILIADGGQSFLPLPDQWESLDAATGGRAIDFLSSMPGMHSMQVIPGEQTGVLLVQELAQTSMSHDVVLRSREISIAVWQAVVADLYLIASCLDSNGVAVEQVLRTQQPRIPLQPAGPQSTLQETLLTPRKRTS